MEKAKIFYNTYVLEIGLDDLDSYSDGYEKEIEEGLKECEINTLDDFLILCKYCLDVEKPIWYLPIWLYGAKKIFKTQMCQIIKYMLQTKNVVIFRKSYLRLFLLSDYQEFERHSTDLKCQEFFREVILAAFLCINRYDTWKEDLSKNLDKYIRKRIIEHMKLLQKEMVLHYDEMLEKVKGTHKH